MSAVSTQVDTASDIKSGGQVQIAPELVDYARATLLAAESIDSRAVGDFIGVTALDGNSVAVYFTANLAGYRGWRWCAVFAFADGLSTDADGGAAQLCADDNGTLSETALLPGDDALIAPRWVPWAERVQAGDLAPGDVVARRVDDVHLEPGYRLSGDPELDDVAGELGLGKPWVLSDIGRIDAAQRWFDGEFGPNSAMAHAAEYQCVDCAFFLPVAGALSVAFGVCANEIAADGHVVHIEYGCGAHSSVEMPADERRAQFDPFDDGSMELTV